MHFREAFIVAKTSLETKQTKTACVPEMETNSQPESMAQKLDGGFFFLCSAQSVFPRRANSIKYALKANNQQLNLLLWFFARLFGVFTFCGRQRE